MPDPVSTSHADDFLKRERQELGRLRLEIGSEVVAKLDRLLLRDILYERKERRLREEFGEREEGDDPRHQVMINMRGARAQPLATERPTGRRRSRQLVGRLQRSAQLAQQRLEADLRQRGAEVRESYWLTKSIVSELTVVQIEQIASREDVETIVVLKQQPVSCLDVSRPLIQADQVENNLGFDGSDVDVAVIDTGVDAAHAALAGVIVSQQDFTGEGIGDLGGHGTHCAGIIASQDETFRGIAPGVNIWDFKMMNQFGNSQPNWAIAAVQAAVAAGVDVASNSWGWSHANGAWVDPDGTCILCTAAQNAVAAGVVFVVAAGNENNDTCSTYDTHIRCPGMSIGDVITVGGSNDSDNMYGNSSIGPTPDGRRKPDVIAPGVSIRSLQNGGGFVDNTGTSMACPHVAGLAALMLDKNRALTPANVRGILMATAVDIGATVEEQGAGRVDALAAVNAA